ncbi:MAG: FAD-dependent oxidoreductase [Truepera sp.]|nr:FAD-dependent oxidoreductase [Truepera sp.]
MPPDHLGTAQPPLGAAPGRSGTPRPPRGPRNLGSSAPRLTLIGLLLTLLSCTFAQSYDYEVIVVGSEPEAISAAIAAAESGAKTLLVSEDRRLGGLFVEAMLNVLDLRTRPFVYQRGIFERWWQRVGRGMSFDVREAEEAFAAMLATAGVEVRLASPTIRLELVEEGRVGGVRVGTVYHSAAQVIDGTGEMSAAAEAGAGFSVGFGSFGVDVRMVDTLVFRIAGVDWSALRKGIAERGPGYAHADESVAWGHFGGYPVAYEASDPDLRLRGLNLGRQRDGTVLVNALLIYGLDPFDPSSLADGRSRAAREAELITAYLAQEIPGFEAARLAGFADRLYLRETRHLEAVCTLEVDDLLDNRVTDLDVAAGGYPLDVQPLTPFDSGFVFGAPDIYGVRLCVAVPADLDGVWVVGKAAGFDPLAAASARVVPFGMAVAEAVGVAAAKGALEGRDPRSLVADIEAQQEIRATLTRRGALLPPLEARAPTGPYQHPHYDAYRLLLSRGLATGGYNNDPKLDAPMTALNYLYLLSNVGTRFLGDDSLGPALLEAYGSSLGPLTPELALEFTEAATCLVSGCPLPPTRERLHELGVVPPGLQLSNPLTRGQMYRLAAGVARLAPDPP